METHKEIQIDLSIADNRIKAMDRYDELYANILKVLDNKHQNYLNELLDLEHRLTETEDY